MPVALSSLLSTIESMGCLTLAVGIFAWRLQKRDRFWLRAGAAIGVTGTLAFLLFSGTPVVASTGQTLASSHLLLVIALSSFSLLLVLSTLGVMLAFRASVWTALFCGTAGYVLQNFTSGAVELVMTVAGCPESAVSTPEQRLFRFLVNMVCAAVIYLSFYYAVARKMDRRGLEQIKDPLLLAVMVVVMFGVIGSDLVIKGLSMGVLSLPYVFALRATHGLLCILTYALEYELLVSRHLAAEQRATEQVLAERERQYQRSRENVEAINIKCHDIRHQIRRLADGGLDVDRDALADIAREVSVYDARVETGNEALDTILSEKSLACSAAGITLSCVADGAALGAMAPADIYSLFGNALDNAIEAVDALPDPARRSISLVVRQVAGVVSIHVENYFFGEAPSRTANGGLTTTKADRANHGFGVRSMQLIVERYGGTLTTMVEGDKFHLNAMLPAA